MHKLHDATGISLGKGTEEAIRRMEAGEDPDEMENELGDLLGQRGTDPGINIQILNTVLARFPMHDSFDRSRENFDEEMPANDPSIEVLLVKTHNKSSLFHVAFLSG